MALPVCPYRIYTTWSQTTSTFQIIAEPAGPFMCRDVLITIRAGNYHPRQFWQSGGVVPTSFYLPHFDENYIEVTLCGVEALIIVENHHHDTIFR